MHSTRGTEQDLIKSSGFRLQHMDSALYENLITQILDLPQPPKMINFCGIGEPLCNPQFSEIVKLLRKRGYDGRIITYTNGVLLNREWVDKLTDCGMTQIRISVNGLSSKQMKQVTGVNVSMEKYLDNIRLLYENKSGVQIYVKTVDNILENAGDRERFFAMFGDICDNMFVENLVSTQQQMGDYNGFIDFHTSLFGERIQRRKVCACMFYQLHIDCEGDVFSCIALGKPRTDSIGNIRDSSLKDIWFGEKRLNLLRQNLTKGSESISLCEGCGAKYDINTPEEILDENADEILKRLSLSKSLPKSLPMSLSKEVTL
jgi:radical SAM protein with 4Fe4S-binding SPASM domain